MSETSDKSETVGRLRREMNVAYAARGFKPNVCDEIFAGAIDRLAADVAEIKAKVGAVEPDDVRHFVESEKAWVSMATEQRDAAIRERDEATRKLDEARRDLDGAMRGNTLLTNDVAALTAEVRRLRAMLEQPPAAPQPAAPPAGWLTEEERCILRNVSEMTWGDTGWYGRVTTTLQAILSRAGTPPVVEVPAIDWVTFSSTISVAQAYRDAMDKAGVKWKEVPRE